MFRQAIVVALGLLVFGSKVVAEPSESICADEGEIPQFSGFVDFDFRLSWLYCHTQGKSILTSDYKGKTKIISEVYGDQDFAIRWDLIEREDFSDLVMSLRGLHPSRPPLFDIDLVERDTGNAYFSAWSMDPPVLEDFDGDGVLDMLITQETRKFDNPEATGWPVLVRLGDRPKLDDLYYYPVAIRISLERQKKFLEHLMTACSSAEGDSCIYGDNILILKGKISALEGILSSREKAGEIDPRTRMPLANDTSESGK